MNLFPERPQPPLAGLPCGAVREGGGREATRCRGRDPGLRAPSPVPPRWPSLSPAVEWAQGPRLRGSRGGVEAITWDPALHPLPPTPTSQESGVGSRPRAWGAGGGGRGTGRGRAGRTCVRPAGTNGMRPAPETRRAVPSAARARQRPAGRARRPVPSRRTIELLRGTARGVCVCV